MKLYPYLEEDIAQALKYATRASGGFYSFIRTLGIGINFPEYGWTAQPLDLPPHPYSKTKESQVA